MQLGIDVGGTFTDAVVIDKSGKIISSVKTPTTHEELLTGIISAIDKVLQEIKPENIKRASLSTTIVTNTLVQGKEDAAALFLMSGPGMNIASYVPTKPVILSGYTDHRGHMAAAPSKEEVERACKSLGDKTKIFAVSGKFAIRNPALEMSVFKWIKGIASPEHITLGSLVSGELNYLRRTNSAYYNAAVWRTFLNFTQNMAAALKKREIKAPVYILKADGGTMPLNSALDLPVETIFTGPAASVLGVMALTEQTAGQAISLDIGGTTTDIAFWQNGKPLFAAGGARINGYPTSVRSFWLNSVGVGGDSYVREEAGLIKVGPMRKGPAMALGGSEPTLFDAVRFLNLSQYGDKHLAAAAMAKLAKSLNSSSLEITAKEVINTATDLIVDAISKMLLEQTQMPVYKVEDIVKEVKFEPKIIIGVGGAAKGLVETIAKKFNVPFKMPSAGLLANAVGAAVAAPTTQITLRADTAQGYLTVPELSLKKNITAPFTVKEAWREAEAYLKEKATAMGISEELIKDTERVYEEEFNVIRSFFTQGKIIVCKMQLKPRALFKVKGDELP